MKTKDKRLLLMEKQKQKTKTPSKTRLGQGTGVLSYFSNYTTEGAAGRPRPTAAGKARTAGGLPPRPGGGADR